MPENRESSLLRDPLYRIWNRVWSLVRPTRASSLPGMGAQPARQGTTFRVWAPHARRVAVSGSFNNWSRERHPLASEGNGFWSGQVSAAGAGDAYKYAIENGRLKLMKGDPYALEVEPGPGNAVVRGRTATPEANEPPAWMPNWNTMVIYELHVGTFAPSDPQKVGTFADVLGKLPYLRDLGINAVEIMPIAEFAGDRSWGYNPAHPYAVEKVYGGGEAFKQLVEAAHEHGIAVILDVVYNHFGPQDLELWQFDGWSENGLGGIYFYNDWRSNTPWGDTRPDYGRGEVRQYIRDNALMWFDEYGVDGLRWDATAYIRNAYGNDSGDGEIAEGWSLMQWINNEIDARWPWAINIAEDLRGNGWITRPVAAGGAGFDAQWDANFVHPIRAAVIAADDAQRDMEAVAAALRLSFEGDVFDRIIYTESHDEVANGHARVPEEISPGGADSEYARRRACLGAALVFTAPGIPMIFQGQEFLESGWFDDTVPLDWGKVKENGGLVALYRDLIALRRNSDGSTRGLTGQNIALLHVDNQSKLIAFQRWANGEDPGNVVVIANFANAVREAYELPFPVDGQWSLRFNSDAVIYDPAFDSTPSADTVARDGRATVTIGPYSVLIYTPG